MSKEEEDPESLKCNVQYEFLTFPEVAPHMEGSCNPLVNTLQNCLNVPQIKLDHLDKDMFWSVSGGWLILARTVSVQVRLQEFL